MASSTAPISLVTWIQDRITTLYRATSPTAFDAAFDALLHDSAQIHVNGVQLTRDEYKRRLQAQRPVASSATVAFSNIVHVPGKTVGNQEVLRSPSFIAHTNRNGHPPADRQRRNLLSGHCI